MYLEHNVKIQPSTPAYAGNFNFGPDSLNGINNTGEGFANALLGYVDTYSQATARAVPSTYAKSGMPRPLLASVSPTT